ncbi:MAG: hypothetical protein IPI66_00290 [Chitinophagaceae bacterium]|nr:hypothetical protein [Chitinophagaceae bacterium]MBL0054654.1 hypothetical protein [Chitinophagaceae bacterium]
MKKTMNLATWLAAFALFGTFVLSGCKKDNSSAITESNPAEEANTLTATTEEAETDAQFDDVFNITASMNTSQVGEDLGLGSNVSGLFELGANTPSNPPCFTIEVVPNIPGVFPKTVTIDFGTGCLGRDGKFRKGKIVSIYTNRMLVPGAKVSTTFVGYYVDSFHIEGTHITENTSTSNMQGWKNTVIDGQVTNTITNRWVKWNTTKNVLQIEGNGTPRLPLDDVYKITGFGRGSNSAGHSWAALVMEPLIKKFTCRWIVKGTVKLIRDGREALLDYGNGNCDNLAIIYINGVGHVIRL